MVIIMNEIKVEKDVVLKNSFYYFNMLYDEIAVELAMAKKNNDKDKFYRLAFARSLLAELTDELFMNKIDSIGDKEYDIDSAVKKYNDNCNIVIREFINKERE